MTKSASPAAKLSKISFKLPAAIIFAAIITALSAGFLGYQQINNSITSAVNNRVEIILNNQKQSLAKYLAEIENDLHQKAISPSLPRIKVSPVVPSWPFDFIMPFILSIGIWKAMTPKRLPDVSKIGSAMKLAAAPWLGEYGLKSSNTRWPALSSKRLSPSIKRGLN